MKHLLLLVLSALALSAQSGQMICGQAIIGADGKLTDKCFDVTVPYHSPVLVDPPKKSVHDVCGQKNKTFKVRCLGQDITIQFREFYVPTVHIVKVYSIGNDTPIVSVSEPWQTSLKVGIVQTIAVEKIEVQRLQWAEEETAPASR